jgi:hypothetical protein
MILAAQDESSSYEDGVQRQELSDMLKTEPAPI